MKKIYKYLPHALSLLIVCTQQILMIAGSQTRTQPAKSTQTSKKSSLLTATNSPIFRSSMPTDSINEKAIDTIYGEKGLKYLGADIIQIKQTYSYIESMAKNYKISTNPKF